MEIGGFVLKEEGESEVAYCVGSTQLPLYGGLSHFDGSRPELD
jgi:hypothetical protein